VCLSRQSTEATVVGRFAAERRHLQPILIDSCGRRAACAEQQTRVVVVKYTDIAVRGLTCHTATGTRMPYGITQCYLPPDRADIPALTPAEAGTRLSDLKGMQG